MKKSSYFFLTHPEESWFSTIVLAVSCLLGGGYILLSGTDLNTKNWEVDFGKAILIGISVLTVSYGLSWFLRRSYTRRER
jgi:hypothetical protein